MCHRTPVAGLSVVLVCLGIMSACGDAPTRPAPIAPARIDPGPVAPGPVGPDLKGSYALTMELGDTCSGLPAAARTRTYSATIEDYQRQGSIADYLVTLSGATFAAGCGNNGFGPGIACHQFFGTKWFGGLTFYMLDPEYGDGGQIKERFPDGSQLFVASHQTPARLEGSAIDASGKADIYYCAVADEMTGRCSSPVTYCETNEFRLRFDRRP